MWTGALKKKFFYILFLLINYLNLSQPSEMTLEEAKKRASVCVALALCDFFFARSKSQAWKERALKKGRVHCPLKIDGGAEPKKVKSARSYKCTRALSEKAFPDWLQKMCHYK